MTKVLIVTAAAAHECPRRKQLSAALDHDAVHFFFRQDDSETTVAHETAAAIKSMETATELTWLAVDPELDDAVILRMTYVDQSVEVSFYSQFSKIVQLVESSCYRLQKLNIVTLVRHTRLFEDWLGGGELQHVPETSVAFTPLPLPSPSPLSHTDTDTDTVVSSLAWGLDGAVSDLPDAIKAINVVLTPDLFRRETAVALRQRCADRGIEIRSVNGLFYAQQCNVATSWSSYVVHFRRVIEVASLLGAKYIIYGSPASRAVSASRKIDMQRVTKDARATLVKTMRQLADFAKTFADITIVMKPSARDTFRYLLTSEQEVRELVSDIDAVNVVAGPMRDVCAVTRFPNFDLVEFEGTRERLAGVTIPLLKFFNVLTS
ncbi:hypothetical protein FOA52_004156 [Chlamydomonas sp. UWO 241]|nr:hypothetical protein FOA52_004156 [Chlamydomonas sp. UWO 241]